MTRELGPQSRRVYAQLREGILRGEYRVGTALPAYTALAKQFGVSPVTMRQVLALLEQEGLLSRQQGRGTFVRSATTPAVLIVDDETEIRDVLRRFVTASGHLAIEADSPAAALALLESGTLIGLILTDVRMPNRSDGVEFIRTVRRRWPDLPLAALTGYPDDLTELHGTAEYPVLNLTKPVRLDQIREVFRYVVGNRLPGANNAL
jgi:CheY-like chemotaxis protein